MISTLFTIMVVLLLAILAYSVAYLFLFALAGRIGGRRRAAPAAEPTYRIALMVPAYKEDAVIRSTAVNLLKQRYPRELFEIFIIADSLASATLEDLKSLPVRVLPVSFEKSTKTKALNEAFRRINEPFDIALILDADNQLAPDFLKRISDAFAEGAEAVQAHRVAKNLDTPFAILDACSEEINNHIFRRGANTLGLSASVIGSGMACGWERLQRLMSGIHAVGGFDKVLQLRLVEEGTYIRYLEGAYVFDEKVASPDAFRHQRSRWVSSQFIYLQRFAGAAFRQLLRGNFDFFNLAVAGNLILPRAFLMMLLPVALLLGWLHSTAAGIAALVISVAYGLSLVLALPPQMMNSNLAAAVARIPAALFSMLAALLHLRKADRSFIHTVHTQAEVTNTLYKEDGA